MVIPQLSLSQQKTQKSNHETIYQTISEETAGNLHKGFKKGVGDLVVMCICHLTNLLTV